MSGRRRAVALVLVLASLTAGCGSGTNVTAEIGKRAPTFDTFDLNGEPVRLDDYEGEVVILNFWASWCVPCRKEFPVLQSIHGRDGVTVLGVVFDDTADNAKKFMTAHDASWPGLLDNGDIARAYGVGKRPGIPVTFAIDADGVLRQKHLGEADREDLDALVDAAR